MAAGAPGQQGQSVSFKVVVPTDLGEVPALYANHVQATVTPEDLTLHLGWYALPPFMEPPKGEVEVHVRPVVKVSLPLNLIRGTIRVLEAQITAWEQNWGEIPPHPNPAPIVPDAAEVQP